MKEHVYSQNMIVGHFAMWAVRLSPYPVPDELETVLDALGRYIRSRFTTDDKCEEKFMFKSNERDLKTTLDSFISNSMNILKWEVNDVGDEDSYMSCPPCDKVKVVDGFIDLNSLLGNVCDSIHRELKSNEEFDEEIDRELEREQNK